MSIGLRFAVLSLAALFCAALFAGTSRDANDALGPIACRVMEAHASASPAVIAVVFHQQSSEDQERLAVLLQQHSGETVGIQLAGGPWIPAPAFRLKSCFGRGLLLLPAGAATIQDGSSFLIRFPPSSDRN